MSDPEDEVPDVVTNSEKYKTYEEDEDCLFESRAKLYRYDTENSEWKERGTGPARILKNKDTQKIRFLMRRDKTYKICGHQYVHNVKELKPNKSNEKSWIWDCPADYSEDLDKPMSGIYAIRFQTLEDAQAFKTAWNEDDTGSDIKNVEKANNSDEKKSEKVENSAASVEITEKKE